MRQIRRGLEITLKACLGGRREGEEGDERLGREKGFGQGQRMY